MILSYSLPINDTIDSPARFLMVIGTNHSGVHFSPQDAFVVGIRPRHVFSLEITWPSSLD